LDYSTNGILVPLAIAILVLWILYRRARRLIGEQDVSQRKLRVRIIITFALTALVMLLPSSSLLVCAAGLLLGLALALIGVATTTIHSAGQRYRYTPNTLLGMLILALLLGRWIYRALAANRVSQALSGDLGELPAALGRDPAARILILGLLTYLTAYHIGILAKSARRVARD
jgi:hypothetical protein